MKGHLHIWSLCAAIQTMSNTFSTHPFWSPSLTMATSWLVIHCAIGYFGGLLEGREGRREGDMKVMSRWTQDATSCPLYTQHTGFTHTNLQHLANSSDNNLLHGNHVLTNYTMQTQTHYMALPLSFIPTTPVQVAWCVCVCVTFTSIHGK